MLVLTRSEEEKIRFPELGITVQVLRVKGSKVRVGIDAPLEVRVVRDEIDGNGPPTSPQAQVIRLPRKVRHDLRNQLNMVSLALHMFKQQVDVGHAEADETFDKLVSYIQQLSDNRALSRIGVLSEPAVQSALVVDDEPNERELLAGFLQMHGYEVATASDGVETINYLDDNETPSVILLDMFMPRCDGRTLLHRLRSNPRFDDTRIFVISGSSPGEVGLDAQRDGINRWFTKPLNPKQLFRAIGSELPEPEPCAA